MSGFADSNRAGLRYIKEDDASWGTTPATGATREMRLTSSSLAANKETDTSDELRADRMVSSVIETAATTEGDVELEWSAGSYDDFLQAFVLGAWTRPMTFDFFKGITVSITSTSKVVVSGVDVSAYWTTGRRIKLEGFVNPNNNGYFQISGVSYTGGNTEITVTTTTFTIEAGSVYTKVMDANDVVILKNTSIRSGTSSAATFDSNGGNAFASPRSAGQLVPGQKIWVDGLGHEKGTIAFSDVVDAGASVTISDGVNSQTFVAGTDYAVGADATASGANLAAAINAKRPAGSLNVNASAATGTVTVTNLNDVHGSITENADPGSDITVTDFSGLATSEHGFFTIVSATDDILTVSPAPATNANSGSLAVTIKASMLRNPGDVDDITAQSFTVETSYNDIAKYTLHKGLRVGNFELTVEAGSIVTGKMSFQGKDTTGSGTSTLNDTGSYSVLDSTATEVMNATTNVGAITLNGATLATAVQSIEIKGDASLRNQMAVSSKFPNGIGTGRFTLEGTLKAYFEDLTMWDHFLDHDTVSLGWDFVDIDSNVYYFTIPALKITSDPIGPSGIDEDIMEEMEFTAFRDSSTECMLQIDRFSSTKYV